MQLCFEGLNTLLFLWRGTKRINYGKFHLVLDAIGRTRHLSRYDRRRPQQFSDHRRLASIMSLESLTRVEISGSMRPGLGDNDAVQMLNNASKSSDVTLSERGDVIGYAERALHHHMFCRPNPKFFLTHYGLEKG